MATDSFNSIASEGAGIGARMAARRDWWREMGENAETFCTAPAGGVQPVMAAGLLDTIASFVADRNPDPAIAATVQPAAQITTLTDVHNTVAAAEVKTWQPQEVASTTALGNGGPNAHIAAANKEKDGVKNETVVMEAEAQLNDVAARERATGERAIDTDARVAAADNNPGAAHAARGLAADAAITAGLTAVSPAAGAIYAAMTAHQTVKNAFGLFSGSGTMATFNETATELVSATATKAERLEARRSGSTTVERAQDAPAAHTFDRAARGIMTASVAADPDLVPRMTLARDSLDGTRRALVAESPEIVAMRGTINQLKETFANQRVTGREVREGYEHIGRDGMEINGNTMTAALDRGIDLRHDQVAGAQRIMVPGMAAA